MGFSHERGWPVCALREGGAWCYPPHSLQTHVATLTCKATMPLSIPSPLAGHCPCGFKAIKGAAATTKHATAQVSEVTTQTQGMHYIMFAWMQAKHKTGQGVSLPCACTQEPPTLTLCGAFLSASVPGLASLSLWLLGL